MLPIPLKVCPTSTTQKDAGLLTQMMLPIMEDTRPAMTIFLFPNRLARGQIKSIPAARGIPLIRASTDCTISPFISMPSTLTREKNSLQYILKINPPLNMTPD